MRHCHLRLTLPRAPARLRSKQRAPLYTLFDPLHRQVLQKILAEFGHRTGHEHPHFRTAINNYAVLLSAMDWSLFQLLSLEAHFSPAGL
jgi:hypothetical protein